jgi:hypothetical protein
MNTFSVSSEEEPREESRYDLYRARQEHFREQRTIHLELEATRQILIEAKQREQAALTEIARLKALLRQ